MVLQLTNYRVSKVECTDYASFCIAKAKNFNQLLQNSKCDNISLLGLTEPDRNILLSWGRGSSGCLDLGDTDNRNVPTITNILSQPMDVKDITCGANHIIAKVGDATGKQLYSWGSNSVG